MSTPPGFEPSSVAPEKKRPVRDAAVWTWDMFGGKLWTLLSNLIRGQLQRIPFSKAPGAGSDGGQSTPGVKPK